MKVLVEIIGKHLLLVVRLTDDMAPFVIDRLTNSAHPMVLLMLLFLWDSMALMVPFLPKLRTKPANLYFPLV